MGKFWKAKGRGRSPLYDVNEKKRPRSPGQEPEKDQVQLATASGGQETSTPTDGWLAYEHHGPNSPLRYDLGVKGMNPQTRESC